MKNPKLNKLYFMSATEEWYEEGANGNKLLKISWASEIIIARDDEWAQKVAYKQNSAFEKHQWKIDRSYDLEELVELFRQKDHAITELGASY